MAATPVPAWHPGGGGGAAGETPCPGPPNTRDPIAASSSTSADPMTGTAGGRRKGGGTPSDGTAKLAQHEHCASPGGRPPALLPGGTTPRTPRGPRDGP